MEIKEHQKLFDDFQTNIDWFNALSAKDFTLSNDEVFIFWDHQQRAYFASYVIGAQIINGHPVIVTPKFPKIDYLKMFDYCLRSGIESDSFSKIYGIDSSGIKIKTNAFKENILSPLLVTHYLAKLEELISKGLKKGYISREANIKKVKGKLITLQNDRKNIMNKRFDRFVCCFQEYSTDIPENRLLKKALLFSKQIIFRMQNHESFTGMTQSLKKCLFAFGNVSDHISVSELNNLKGNKLFKDYVDAIQLAKMILKRFDYSISKVSETRDDKEVPPFWIDMPLLYEHYVLGLLKEKGNSVLYQKSYNSGKPDFLMPNEKLILDTKYKDTDTHNFDLDNVRQLSGYARDNRLRKDFFGKNETDEIIKCVLIYPNRETIIESDNEHKKKNIPVYDGSIPIIELIKAPEASSKSYKEFYRICVELPVIESK